jgi:hypothetical protein
VRYLSPEALRHQVGGRLGRVRRGRVLVYMLAVFHRTALSVSGVTAAERFGITVSQLAPFTMVQLLCVRRYAASGGRGPGPERLEAG